MTRSEVADTLARWRAAIRAADSMPADTEARTAAETDAQRLHEEYLAAVTRMTGGRDQVGGAIESSRRKPAEALDTVRLSRDLQRRTADRPRPGGHPSEPRDETDTATAID